MVLFLLILGWSFLESLGQSVGRDRRTTCNLHLKGDPEGGGGGCQPPLRCLSQFLSYEKDKIQLLMALLLPTFSW